MRRYYLATVICLAALFCASAALARLSATVDRNQLALDETVNLTITKDGISSIDSADLQPLAQDFQILGQSQSTNAQYLNGSMSSSFTMNLVLAPRRAGNLQIPALTIGKEKTLPLPVKVVTQAQPKTRADNTPLYIETEVSAKTVPVQAQLIYTLRIFWAVEASINEPADPQLQDAQVERLTDATFDKVVDGRSYKVFERKYAIFPQKSGVLTIPQLVVKATVPDRQQRHSGLYGFFGTTGKEVKLRSEAATITVMAKVAEYPAGAEWLPTAKLSVAEDWSQEPEQLQVGESATITIAMAAQGLQGSQLPPVTIPATDGVKLYQGKAEVENLTNPEGITGLRKESIALIPIRAGKMVLPEIRIPWWDINEEKVAYAVIPARNLVVKEGKGASGTSGIVLAPSVVAPSPGVSGPRPSPASPGITELNKPLLGIVAFILVGWLLTIYLLLQNRRRLATLRGGGAIPAQGMAAPKEEEAFQKLSQSCRSNEPARARKAALDWASSLRPGARVRTAADLARLFPDSGLQVLLEEIDNILYRPGDRPVAWRGQDLLLAIEKIRKEGRRREEPALQELYK